MPSGLPDGFSLPVRLEARSEGAFRLRLEANDTKSLPTQASRAPVRLWRSRPAHFAGRSPHPLPHRKVRFARNALRGMAFLAPLPCSSVSNGTRFAGLPFEKEGKQIRRYEWRNRRKNCGSRSA